MKRNTLKKIRITLCVLQGVNVILYSLSSFRVGFFSQLTWYPYVFMAFTLLFGLYFLFQFYLLKKDDA